MIARKKKLRLIQSFLLLVAIIILYLTYSNKQTNLDEKKIISKDVKDKILEQELLKKDLSNENVFYNIEYSGIDLSGNRFILKSKEATSNNLNEEIIKLKNVEAFFYFRNDKMIKIRSEYGQYNNKTLDMKFDTNITADYDNQKLVAQRASYSNSEGFLNISKKVKITDVDGSFLNADELLFDIKNQKLDIKSFNNNKINAKIKNEKRF